MVQLQVTDVGEGGLGLEQVLLLLGEGERVEVIAILTQ